MSEVTFRKILWNNKEGHDKLWCSFLVNDSLYCAWGRRGGKLSFKYHGFPTTGSGQYKSYHAMKLEKLEQQKMDKGYNEVDNFLLFSIFPDFEDKVEQELTLNLLASKI